MSEHTERFLELALHKYATYRSKRLSRRKIQDGLKYLALGSLVLLQMGHLPMGETLMVNVVGALEGLLPRKGKPKRSGDLNLGMGDGNDTSYTSKPEKTEQGKPMDPPEKKKGRIFGLFGTPGYSKSMRKSTI